MDALEAEQRVLDYVFADCKFERHEWRCWFDIATLSVCITHGPKGSEAKRCFSDDEMLAVYPSKKLYRQWIDEVHAYENGGRESA